jgi:hypothetical protein
MNIVAPKRQPLVARNGVSAYKLASLVLRDCNGMPVALVETGGRTSQLSITV